MNLVIDEGNTLAKVYVFEKSQNILCQFSYNKITIEGLEKDFLNKYPDIHNAILCSVRIPDIPLKKYLISKVGRFIELTNQTPIPVENCYKTKDTLGADRIALVVGANTLFPKQNVLIIDCGTAITYDFINENNQYLGGNISPGMEMRFKALHQLTQKLPLLSAVPDPSLIGESTNEAITNGVIKGIINEIDGYILEMTEKYPSLKTILTGGDSNYFAKFLKNTIFVDSLILVKGLNSILDYNLINENN